MSRILIRRIGTTGPGDEMIREAALKPGLNLLCGGHESGKTLLTRSVGWALCGQLGVVQDGLPERVFLELESVGKTILVTRRLPGGEMDVNERDADSGDGEEKGSHGLHPWLEQRLQQRGSRSARPALDDADQALESFRTGLLEAGFLDRLIGSAGLLREDEAESNQVIRRLEAIEKEWYRLQGTEGGEGGGEGGNLPSSAEVPAPTVPSRPEPTNKLDGTAADEARVRNRSEREDLLRDLRRTGLPLDLPEDLPAILRESEKIRQELISLQKEAAEIRRQLMDLKDLSRLLLPALLTMALLAAGAGFGWWRGNLGFGLLGGLVLSLPGWLLGFRQLLKVRTVRARLKGQGGVIEERREAIQERLAQLDARFEAVGMSPSAVEIVRMQKNLVRHQELRDRLRQVEGALGVLGGAEEVVDVPAEGPPVPLMDPGSQEEFPREAGASASARSLKEVEAEGEGLHQRQKFLERRIRRRSDLLGDVLGRKVGTAADIPAALDAFSAELGEAWTDWSGRRYRSLRLVPERRTVLLEAADGSTVGWDRLSAGLRASLDLLARVSCALRLEEDRMPWLVLDDPFDQLDPTRQLKAAKLLEAAARSGRQILVTSRDPSWLRFVRQSRWHVIELEQQEKKEAETSQKEANSDVRQLHLL